MPGLPADCVRNCRTARDFARLGRRIHGQLVGADVTEHGRRRSEYSFTRQVQVDATVRDNRVARHLPHDVGDMDVAVAVAVDDGHAGGGGACR